MRPKVGTVGFFEDLFGWRMGLGLWTKVVVSNAFLIFIPDPLGRWSNLTGVFQLGWNHQLVQALFGWCFERLFYLRFSAQAYQRQPCHSKGDMMIWSNLTIDTAYFSRLETTTKLFKWTYHWATRMVYQGGRWPCGCFKNQLNHLPSLELT